MISSFQFSCPIKTSFGAHALYHLPFDLAGMDAGKAFIITDQCACDAQLDMQLSNAFRDSDTGTGVAKLTDQDFTDPQLFEKLYVLFTEKGYDSIIVLGTGMLMQIAKILNMAVNQGPEFLSLFAEKQAVNKPLHPLVYIPTLPTDGSETGMNATFQDKNFVSNYLMPDLLVISPDLMLNPPDDMLINSGLSSLTVCCEAFVFSDNPLARPYAELGISLIMDSLLPLLQDSDRDKDRAIDVKYGKASAKQQLNLAELVHASAISGFLKSNIRDMKTPEKTTGQDMVQELLNIFKNTDSPWLTKLLLPLTNQEQYSGTAESRRPELAVQTIRNFLNKVC